MRDKLKAMGGSLKNPAWLAFVWFGLSAGISLLEAPVKFTAPTLTRPVALDVGRVVFQALNKVELVLLILMLVLLRVSGQTKTYLGYACVITLIMIAQSVWLLPELSARSVSIVAGIEPGPSVAHGAYAVTELLKLATLFLLGLQALSPNAR